LPFENSFHELSSGLAFICERLCCQLVAGKEAAAMHPVFDGVNVLILLVGLRGTVSGILFGVHSVFVPAAGEVSRKAEQDEEDTVPEPLA
jgi:hypothetical protein